MKNVKKRSLVLLTLVFYIVTILGLFSGTSEEVSPITKVRQVTSSILKDHSIQVFSTHEDSYICNTIDVLEIGLLDHQRIEHLEPLVFHYGVVCKFE